MLFSKPSLYFYRKRNSLVIYDGKNTDSVATIEIPKDVEKNEEILNLSKFQNLVSDQVKSLVTKGQKVIILLADEVIFQKTIPSTDSRPQDQQIQSFLEDVPFDPGKIAQIQLATQDGLLLAATNRDLYEPIVGCIDQVGAETSAVLPAQLFGGGEAVSQELFENIKKNSQLVKKGNLLNLQAKEEKAQVKSQEKAEPKVDIKKEAPANNQKQTKLLIAAIALIVIGIVAIAYYVTTQFVFKKPKPAPAAENQTQAPVISNQESTETAQPSTPQESTASP